MTPPHDLWERYVSSLTEKTPQQNIRTIYTHIYQYGSYYKGVGQVPHKDLDQGLATQGYIQIWELDHS